MRKQLVTEKQSRFAARDRTANTGQVMQLPEGAGKGRFTALVRTGYDKDALAMFQVKVIGHDGATFPERGYRLRPNQRFHSHRLLWTYWKRQDNRISIPYV